MSNEFISNYLTHWTGRAKSEGEAFQALQSILSAKQLWLKYCPHLSKKLRSSVGEYCLQLTSFTDIPFYLSKKHCKRFGKFGISFHKDKLVNYGANPVFYISGQNKDDAFAIYEYFIKYGIDNFPQEIVNNFKNILSMTQDYSRHNSTYYYEREWRLSKYSLKKEDIRTSIINGKNESYFQFSDDDVAFIIIPRNYEDQAKDLINTVNKIEIYEDLVSSLTKD